MNGMKLDTIAALEYLTIKIKYAGEAIGKSGGKHVMDEWRVTITSGNEVNTFEYFTGTGRRARVYSPTGDTWDKVEKKHFNTKPKAPKNAGVLSCLISDASAADYNFNDWCDNYGYSSDSISAFNVYQACLQTAEKLRKHFSHAWLETARALLQDY